MMVMMIAFLVVLLHTCLLQAIPVMDPETGQETYMIIDPQTAQVCLGCSSSLTALSCRA